MANLRALVKRRKAVRNIRKITKTMELIATSRFKQALDRAHRGGGVHPQDRRTRRRPRARTPGDVSPPAARHAAGEEVAAAGHHRQPRAVRRVQRQHHPRGDGRDPRATRPTTPVRPGSRPASAGSRSSSSRASRGRRSTRSSRTSRRSPRWTRSPTRYIDLYVTGQIDQVKVAYMKFVNAARQEPVVETLLPLSSVAVETRKPAARPRPPRPAGEGRLRVPAGRRGDPGGAGAGWRSRCGCSSASWTPR